MRVTCLQLETVWENRQANYARAWRLLEAAAPPPGGLIVLPEMFATGFSMNVAAAAEGNARPTEGFLAAVACEYRCHVLGGLVSRAAGGRGRNEAVLYGPAGAELARYCKLHPFSYAGETEHYEPGGQVVVADAAGAKLSPFVCYDLRFPEVFRAAARRGAEVLAVIANWPASRQEHWTALLRARAIENQACVVGVNRCGADPNVAYAGGSAVFGPRGEAVAAAGEGEQALSAELDLSAVRTWRAEFPALRDVREEFFGSFGKRTDGDGCHTV